MEALQNYEIVQEADLDKLRSLKNMTIQQISMLDKFQLETENAFKDSIAFLSAKIDHVQL